MKLSLLLLVLVSCLPSAYAADPSIVGDDFTCTGSTSNVSPNPGRSFRYQRPTHGTFEFYRNNSTAKVYWEVPPGIIYTLSADNDPPGVDNQFEGEYINITYIPPSYNGQRIKISAKQRQFSNCSCSSDYDAATDKYITVGVFSNGTIDGPSTVSFSRNMINCTQATFTLSSSSESNGNTYRWATNISGWTLLSGQGTKTATYITGGVSGNRTVSVRIQNACGSTTKSKTVSQTSPPVPVLDQLADGGTFCIPPDRWGSYPFQASAGSPNQSTIAYYDWVVKDQAGQIVHTAINYYPDNTLTFYPPANGTYNYSATAYNCQGASNTLSSSVTITTCSDPCPGCDPFRADEATQSIVVETGTKLSPVPATTATTLTLDNSLVGAQIKVLNTQGVIQNIIENAQQENVIPVSSLSDGIYIVLIEKGNTVKHLRLLVQR